MFFASTTNPYEFCDPFDFTWDQYAQKSTTAWILFLNTKRSYIWVDDVIASTGALLITHSILITRTRATPVTLCQLSGVYRMPPHARGFRFLGVHMFDFNVNWPACAFIDARFLSFISYMCQTPSEGKTGKRTCPFVRSDGVWHYRTVRRDSKCSIAVQ